MAERLRTRFLVVGSGVAGLHTAWRASADDDVMVVTKRSLFDSATAYAQGGIAAAPGAESPPPWAGEIRPSCTASTLWRRAPRWPTPRLSRSWSRKVRRGSASL